MIKVYGSPQSSAGRCFWMLEEAGLKYERQPLNMKNGEHKSPEFLKLNPNGKVPCLVDGDFVIWESMAINSYLAEKYKPELIPSSVESRARLQQWSYWSMLEMQPPLIDVLIQRVFVPEEKRNHQVIEKGLQVAPGKLEILNNHLKKSKYIVGDQFTLADINVGSVANLANAIELDLKPFGEITRWLQAMKDRPAYKIAAQLER